MKTKFLLPFLLVSSLTFLSAQVTVSKVYNFNSSWKNWGSTAGSGLTAFRPNGFLVNSSGSSNTGRLSRQIGFSGLTGDSCMVYSIANNYTASWVTWHVAANVTVTNAATPVDEKAAFADFKIPYGATYTVSFKAKSTSSPVPTAFSFGFVETAANKYDGRTADNWTLLKNISGKPLTADWQTYSFTGTNLTLKTDVTPNLPVDLQNFNFQLSTQNKNVYIDDLTFTFTTAVVTGANSATSNKLSYSVTDGILKIRNTVKGANYSIQNLSGQTVYTGMISNEELNVKLTQKGIYIVSIEGKSCKVIY